MKRARDGGGEKENDCTDEKGGNPHPSKRYTVTVQPLGGDSYTVFINQAVATVREIKMKIVQEVGVDAYRQELYEVAVPEAGKHVVREDDAESRLLCLEEQVAAGMTVTLSVREAVAWDEEWKGSSIELCEEGSVATCTVPSREDAPKAAGMSDDGSSQYPGHVPSFLHNIAPWGGEGQAVRSRDALEPKSGIHVFEYCFRRPMMGEDGESLGGYYMVGVVRASVPKAKFSEKGASLGTFIHNEINNSGVLGSNAWWGLEDDEDIMIAGEESRRVPELSKNKHGQAFGAGDRIGFAINMDKGTMDFFRNGHLIEGASIAGLPTDEQLHLVASLYNNGASVKLTVPDALVEWDQFAPAAPLAPVLAWDTSLSPVPSISLMPAPPGAGGDPPAPLQPCFLLRQLSSCCDRTLQLHGESSFWLGRAEQPRCLVERVVRDILDTHLRRLGLADHRPSLHGLLGGGVVRRDFG
jgi:hypothetical protein